MHTYWTVKDPGLPYSSTFHAEASAKEYADEVAKRNPGQTIYVTKHEAVASYEYAKKV